MLLGLLLGAWGVLIVLRADPTSGNRPAAPPHAPRADVARGVGAAVPDEVPRFRRELLERPVAPYRPAVLNPFGSPPPPPRRPAPVARPEPAPSPVPTPTPAPVAAPPPPPLPPPTPDPFFEEVKQYRLFGTATGEAGAQAFLTRGPDLLVVRANDRLGTQYVVKEVQEEALVLGSADGDKEVVLALPRATPADRPARARRWP